MTEDLLELSALTPVRPRATLRTDANPDGTIYELAVPQEFGTVALSQLASMYAEIETLSADPKLTKAKEKRLDTLVNKLACRLIPDAPKEEVEALPAITKRGLALSFFVKAGEVTMPLIGASASLLASSPPASNGSTAATPETGSS